ncbi:MAG: RNA degradosome polyphosphate kinase [Acidobacteria bacterium 13_1_20CM_3_53_8]|nr:MAG: RNA degradosome polyphosphate kinase [Acidobacteria bacterium 13_1_20CM_3_53_8]
MALPPTLRGSKELLLNRELSLLEFFRRVLEEALDETQPLLERLKFLSIFSSNLDEFFMIRVSALKEQLTGEVTELSPDGMTPAEQLTECRERLLPMIDEQMRCLREQVLPQLKEHGIVLASYDTLSEGERRALNNYFMEHVFPVLTPLAVDPSHPFPYISNRSLNLGLAVEALPEHGITRSLTGRLESRFVRIKVPPVVPRLVPVNGAKSKFVLLEELIAANASALFPRMRAGRCHTFRVTRDDDIEIREDEADDLLRMIEEQLRRRRFGTPVRLEVSDTMPDEMVSYLTESLGLTPADVYVINGPLNVPDLMTLYEMRRPELKDRPFRPKVPKLLDQRKSVFETIKRQDVLLHHPYSSYKIVTDFISEAARDPDVLAIKICLYRTGPDSPIPPALIEASARGKQVTALIELKARFDEENNIEWAKRLEEAGVHVVYGVMGLKTHCKLTLVVRREGEVLRRYVHIATGNYNPTTSCTYTDLGLFTTDERIGADATDLFNFLTGYSRQNEYRQLVVAPVNLRERMLELIKRETEHARAGRPAHIIVKINRLADTQIVRALYEASQAGVSIDLIVRSICMLRPGVQGLSENINVRSIVGRFLEHSRIFYFANGGNEEVFIGSADWMHRNLNRRVEVVTPINDPGLARYLKDVVLAAYLRDNVKARVMLADGTYKRIQPAQGEQRFDSQWSFVEHQGEKESEV